MDNHFSDIRDVVLFTSDAKFRASINNSLLSIGLNEVKIFDMEDSYAKISETLSGCLLLIDIDGLDENLLLSLMNNLPPADQQVFEPILLYSKPAFSQVDLVSKKMLLEKNKNEDLILRLIQYHLLAAAFFPRRGALGEDRMESREQELVLFKSGQNYKRIELAEIDYFQAQGKYIIACVGDKKYVASSQLKILELRYKATFERSHRSYLVNLHKVTGIDKVEGTIELGNKMVLLSDRYKKKFMDRFVIFQ
jgi:hypothetical protein